MIALNKIIAVEKGVKSEAERRKTDLYHRIQKPELFSGLNRQYQPFLDEGERLPPESHKVQMRTSETIKELRDTLIRLWDVVATKDKGNRTAVANLTYRGQLLASDLPATYLIFLEKQLVDLRTFVSKIPLLDPAEDWELNEEQGVYATPPVESKREKKVIKTIEKAKATEHHPAQVELYPDTEAVGIWRTVKLSGALPPSHQRRLLDNINSLIESVKMAREEANQTEVEDVKIASSILGWVLGSYDF